MTQPLADIVVDEIPDQLGKVEVHATVAVVQDDPVEIDLREDAWTLGKPDEVDMTAYAESERRQGIVSRNEFGQSGDKVGRYTNPRGERVLAIKSQATDLGVWPPLVWSMVRIRGPQHAHLLCKAQSYRVV